MVGYGIGKLVIGPTSLFVVSGVFAAMGGGVGSYLGNAVLTTRPRTLAGEKENKDKRNKKTA